MERLSANQRLLKGPRVRENSGSDFGLGYAVSSICRALTGHVESPEKANGIVCPCRNWSVFDFGRCRRTPSVVNCTDSLVMCVVCLFKSQDSHVNSDGRRNAANATQKAVLRFSSS